MCCTSRAGSATHSRNLAMRPPHEMHRNCRSVSARHEHILHKPQLISKVMIRLQPSVNLISVELLSTTRNQGESSVMQGQTCMPGQNLCVVLALFGSSTPSTRPKPGNTRRRSSRPVFL